jgi:hypothetical protein
MKRPQRGGHSTKIFRMTRKEFPEYAVDEPLPMLIEILDGK